MVKYMPAFLDTGPKDPEQSCEPEPEDTYLSRSPPPTPPLLAGALTKRPQPHTGGYYPPWSENHARVRGRYKRTRKPTQHPLKRLPV